MPIWGISPAEQAGCWVLPRRTGQVTAYTLDPLSTDVWNETPLQSVQNLAEFNLVAVVTDDPDKARAWIEQVQYIPRWRPAGHGSQRPV